MSESISLIFKHDVRSILDKMTILLGVRIGFFSPRGEEILAGYNRPSCTYCSLIRENLSMDENCRIADAEMMEKARKLGSAVSYICHGGLREVIIPLFSETSHIGFIMVGQFRDGERPPEGILSLWKKQYGDNRIAEAFLQAPVHSSEKTGEISDLFSLFSTYVMSNYFSSANTARPLESLLTYMRQNMDKPFILADAAALLGRSVSGTADMFRKQTGKSFKVVQGEMKMAKAVELIRRRPRIQIRYIAQELGFSDPLYFSRFFKKHTGISPSLFRDQYF